MWLACRVFRVIGILFGLAAASAAPSWADDPPGVVDAVPVPPAVIHRDAGRVTVRAVRVEAPLTIDGTLTERVYEEVQSFSGLIQSEPDEGAPATERTDTWVLFDDDYLYVSARCWDSAPESEWVANEMRRDNMNAFQNENFTFLLDTFHDRRNAVYLLVTPIGGRLDGQVTDESAFNRDWNPVWEVKTGRFPGGWTLEAAVPFTSLRYRPGRTQVWGFQIRRMVRHKNEVSFLTPIPAARGVGGVFLISQAATLVGLEAPQRSRHLEVKPYAVADLSSDRVATPPISNDPGGAVGLDVKYSVTQNLVADGTVNTDFAQVEADEQQVNLTRFSLFFPEKREFFLENQGLFAFGGAGSGPGPGGGDGNAPVLFYSRRIGLNDGREVPIDVGGRLTGRVGAFSVGVLNIQTGEEPVSDARPTNFSVIRIKRDLLRRSSIGAIVTRRSVATRGPGSNETYGLDATFAFFDNLSMNAYWATTSTEGLGDDQGSYRARLDYAGDLFGVQLERLVVGSDFNPEVGFVRRDDFERGLALFRYSPRPEGITAIRKLSWQGRLDYFTNRAGVLETRDLQGRFGVEFENSDQLTLQYTRSYERLDEPFRIAEGVTIPVGGYGFQDTRLSFALGQQRRLSGSVFAEHGSFFDGEKTGVGFSGGRLELTPQLSVEPSLSFNHVSLPVGDFITQLVTTRTTYTVTPLMFVSALLQYNSSNESVGANVRFRWEYLPGSELFVVYNEQRDTLARRFPELENRAIVVKVNRLLRF